MLGSVAMSRTIVLAGSPTALGGHFAGMERTPGELRRHGLLELETTDGSGNEEQAPDVRMAWPGEEPMAYLRAQVDEVDDELAALLARRAALTAAIQRFKDVPGHAGRDAAREAEIVARMARHAPSLGEAGLHRIMHEVIGASLDAVTDDRGP